MTETTTRRGRRRAEGGDYEVTDFGGSPLKDDEMLICAGPHGPRAVRASTFRKEGPYDGPVMLGEDKPA